MQSVYDAAGRDEGLLALAEAWHARVMADEVVSHAFSHGFHAQHSERLAGYWAEALGGPLTYSERYGDETTVVRLHSGHGPHEEMDERAIACFDRALEDVSLTDEPSAYHDSAERHPGRPGHPRKNALPSPPARHGAVRAEATTATDCDYRL